MGVDKLVQLLTADDAATRRDALWILWKLSQDDEQKARIRECGGINPLISLLEDSNVEIHRHALRTLCNLSFDGTHTLLRHKFGCLRVRWDFVVGESLSLCLVPPPHFAF